MRWNCKECNNLWGNVIFTDKIQVLRYAYCPACDAMTWQESVSEEQPNEEVMLEPNPK